MGRGLGLEDEGEEEKGKGPKAGDERDERGVEGNAENFEINCRNKQTEFQSVPN